MAQILGSSELLADVHEKELCIGCGACVEICPYFKSYKGKTAQLFPCTLEQGRCYAYCPKAEVDLDELCRHIRGAAYDGSPLGKYGKVLAARAGEKIKKGRFQSGGTTTALLSFALKTGVVDAAALTDRKGLVPIARLATHWEEVPRCATSKFMAAPTLSSVNMAVRKGHQRIGLVGTPCQIVAAAQMSANPIGKKEHLVPLSLTVGLFCNWALDTRQLIDVLSKKLDISRIVTMDIPPPPADALVLQTGEEKIEVSLSEIKPLIPHTCFICPDMTAELADVSVGMFEGRPGWNTLIIRSDLGAEIVARSHSEGFIETEEFPTANLMHLSRAAAEKKQRSLRMLSRRGLLNNSGKERAAVRIPRDAVDRILKE
jgi:coenzyme F420 hydrogenase subunit beta